MASSSRVFSQTLRFARNLKNSSSKAQKLVCSPVHVTASSSKNLVQLSRPVASVCGLLSAQSKINLKSKVQFAVPQCSVVRNVAHLTSPQATSEEGSLSSSESGSDSSCEAMEGPHGDDDGLVITSSSPTDDL